MRSDEVSNCSQHPAYKEDVCVDCAIEHLYGAELFTSEMEMVPDAVKPTKYSVRKSEWKKKLERIEAYGGKQARNLFLNLAF